MPEINRDIWQRGATPGVNHRDAERKRNARLALGDVRPHELLVNLGLRPPEELVKTIFM
jgi:hypothetical protein